MEQGDIEFPLTVKKGFVFVMGDNRNRSTDSRFSEVGLVDKRMIMGKVLFRLLPLDRFGTVK
jgi:signal peptidase I